MATSIDALRARVTSLVLAPPFAYVLGPTPDGDNDQPVDLADGTIRLEATAGPVTGHMGLYETRVDALVLTVTRLQRGDPQGCYARLIADVNSLSAAVVRDGALGGGDYNVVDEGRGFQLSHTPGAAASSVRVTLPIDYEVAL